MKAVPGPPGRFWLPKAGNRLDEYEDAFRTAFTRPLGASRRSSAQVAISDGASESAFARDWARILTDTFVGNPPDLCSLTEDSLRDWLMPAQEEWHAGVPWDRIPWHGEAKARAGAFATLLGLTIDPPPDDPRLLSWRAIAVGDSCLFVVREDRVLLSFPLEDAAQFDNLPALVCSNPANAGGSKDGLRHRRGECEPGDLFVLATDALAQWFLADAAAGMKPWQTLLALDPSDWRNWVSEQRREGLMRNDDVTLVMLNVVEAHGNEEDPCPGQG